MSLDLLVSFGPSCGTCDEAKSGDAALLFHQLDRPQLSLKCRNAARLTTWALLVNSLMNSFTSGCANGIRRSGWTQEPVSAIGTALW